MKALLFLLLLATGSSFAQTTFIVEKQNGEPAAGAGVYLYNKMVAKTDELGNATVRTRIVKGDSIRFVNGWNYAWHVAAESYDTPSTFTIRLQPVPSPGQPQTNTTQPVASEKDEPRSIFDENIAMPAGPDKPSEPVTYTITDVEDPAVFPGGTDVLNDFMTKHLRYPETAKQNAIQGTCYLQFVVDAKGDISDIKVLRGVPDCPNCDMEAIRAVKMMPDRRPAIIAGKNVKSIFTLPVKFSL